MVNNVVADIDIKTTTTTEAAEDFRSKSYLFIIYYIGRSQDIHTLLQKNNTNIHIY